MDRPQVLGYLRSAILTLSGISSSIDHRKLEYATALTRRISHSPAHCIRRCRPWLSPRKHQCARSDYCKAKTLCLRRFNAENISLTSARTAPESIGCSVSLLTRSSFPLMERLPSLLATAPGIDIRTSTDRTTWTYVGKMFPSGASWTDTYTGTSNGNLWAPDCTVQGSKFLVSTESRSCSAYNLLSVCGISRSTMLHRRSARRTPLSSSLSRPLVHPVPGVTLVSLRRALPLTTTT